MLENFFASSFYNYFLVERFRSEQGTDIFKFLTTDTGTKNMIGSG